MCNAKANRWFSFLLIAAAAQRVAVVPLPPIQDASASDWSSCRTCGVGVSVLKSQCSPNDACLGAAVQYRSCFISECLANASSFRDLQCAAFNTIGPSQTQYTWTSVKSHSCQLTCAQDGGSGQLSIAAADGTDCSSTTGGRGVCAGGSCMVTGCDGILGSGKVLDKCNRCLAPGGDDGKCVAFFGSIGGTVGATRTQEGNDTVALIPAGASSINVTYVKRPHETGLVMTSTLGLYIFSNHTPGDLQVFGVTLHYDLTLELTYDVQTLLIPGPLPTDIIFQFLPNATTSSSGVYQYYMLNNLTSNVGSSSSADSQGIPGLVWKYGAFSACSATCGRGVETSVAVCTDSEYPDRNIPDDLCSSRPYSIVRWCSMGPCPPRWKALAWSACSASCGGGVQTRPLQCIQTNADGTEVVLNSTSCPSNMPSQKQSCNSRPCQPHWRTSDWGPCSTTCGMGVQTRSVMCVNISGQKIDNVYCEDETTPPPSPTQQCTNSQACCSWAAQEWGPCTGACGSMYQYRTVLCLCGGSGGTPLYQGTTCSNPSQPATAQKCLQQQTSCPTWQTGVWGPCSATCGAGISRRDVYCMNGNGTATGCSNTTKPSSVMTCQASKPCCALCAAGCANIQGIDCNYVKQTGQCNGYYQQACCQTCSGCCST